MNRLILAVFLLFSSTQRPHAEAPDCLPHPTQDCVFQMALRQADDERWPWQIAEGYLVVAYLQEADQTGQAAETRAALLALIASKDPGAAAIMQAVLTAEEPADFLPPAELEEVLAKVAAIPPVVLPRFARLTAARGFEVPRIEISIFRPLSELTPYHQTILNALFAKGALAGVRAEIAGWPNAEERIFGFAELALALARAGEVTKALEVLQMPELANPADLDVVVRFSLVEVWARAGDASKARMIPELVIDNGASPHLEASVIAALVAGDADTAWRLLSMIKPYHRTHSLDVAVDAALVHGPEPVEVLLALMPPEEQAEVLYALGKAQIRVGDVDGAASTIDRLGRVPDLLHYGKILQHDLAPVLAALGRDVEAVHMAADLGRARTTALVAARLE